MADISTLSAAKLQALHEKRDAAVSALTKEFIQAGRGHWRGSDIRTAAKSGDALSLRWVEADAAWEETINEREQRKRWHGSLKPIRRKAA